MNNKIIPQFIAYAGAGVIGTAGHYLTLIILVEVFNIAPVYATTAGFAVGAVINYILNYTYIFQSDKTHIEAASKFFTVAIVGVGINSVIMYVGESVLMINYILVQLVATGVVLVQNFILNRLWTFAGPKTTP